MVKHKLHLFILSLILSIYSIPAYAQSIDSSPYSIYGLGLTNYSGSALNKSLSGTGIGVRSTQFINTTNPASYNSLEFVTQITEAGIYAQKHLLSTGNDRSSSNTANFSGLLFWFKFSQKWAGLVGLTPFSHVGYNVTSYRNLNDELNVQVNYTGNGGINKYFIGTAFKANNNLSLGVSAFLLHGNTQHVELIASGSYTGLEISTKTYVSGAGAEAGLQYVVNPSSVNKFTIGATYRPSLNLHTEKQHAVFNGASLDSLYSDLYDAPQSTVPSKTGFGISLETQRYLFAIDATYDNYPRPVIVNNIQLRNTYRFSTGFEFKGNQNADNYWSYFRSRVSFYTQQNEALILNQNFMNWGTTIGLGVPVPNGRGFVNLSYNYNHLGTSERNLLIQHTHSFSLDFSLMDIWGIKRRFE